MLITEANLRRIVRQAISEHSVLTEGQQLLDNQGSVFNVESNGTVQLVKRGPGVQGTVPLPYTFPPDKVPKVLASLQSLHPTDATLLAAMGRGGAPSAPVSQSARSTIKQGKEGTYEYEFFEDGKVQIIKKAGKATVPPIVLNQQQAIAVAKEQVTMGNQGGIIAKIADGSLVYDPSKKPAAAPADPGFVAGLATSMKSFASQVLSLDNLCAPNVIPLWVYPFMCFLVMRKNPLTLNNVEYREALHRICDIARLRGSKDLANPGDIATAQSLDPKWSSNPQGIVGAGISFRGKWDQGYDYASPNPYMHIAMSLTNFSYTGPDGGPYTFNDSYDFNEPGKVTPPLGNAQYMLQAAAGRNNIMKTVMQKFNQSGTFSAVEDLMRYYEATFNYGGFLITGTTQIPQGYKRPSPKKK